MDLMFKLNNTQNVIQEPSWSCPFHMSSLRKAWIGSAKEITNCILFYFQIGHNDSMFLWIVEEICPSPATTALLTSSTFTG